MIDDELDERPSRGLGEYWAIVRRRRWYTPSLFLSWLIAMTVSFVIPPIYQSDALILVEQQKVPEQFVVPNVTVNLQETMTQQILSRTRLLRALRFCPDTFEVSAVSLIEAM